MWIFLPSLSNAIRQLLTYILLDVLSNLETKDVSIWVARETAQVVEHFLVLLRQLGPILSSPHNPGVIVHTYNPSTQEYKEEKKSKLQSKTEASLG